MKEILKFFKIFKPREVIETILIIITTYVLIDMFNIPTLLEKYGIYSIIILSTSIIFFIINKRVLNLLRVNVYNYLDIILVSSLISTTLYMFFSKYISYTIFKLTRITVLELAIIAFIIIRLVIIYILDRKIYIKNEFNVYDIKELYQNKIDNSNKDLIFLEEKDVNYDLLNRNKIIGDLFNSIKY